MCYDNSKMTQTAKHIVFSGRVQGVGFRFTVMNIANRHGLTGYVRNMSDGTVEMWAQGSPEDIEKSIKKIQESFEGYIKQTTTAEGPTDQGCSDFRITF